MPLNLGSTFTDRVQHLGFTPPHVISLTGISEKPAEHLKTFIQQNYHGSMAWMADTATRRANPTALWPDAQSAIVVGLNYGPTTDPLVTLDHPDKATISVYARNRDYHDIIKGRLKELAGIVARDTGQDVKVFVDTAPLMEKPLAQAAGLGWQGKHTNLVNQEYGSWLFLGVVLTQAELMPTPAEVDHCGSCRACLDICPTDAFPTPYQLDARRCISYLTIEHKGPVDPELRPLMGNRIYGCDDCLAVCPWNKFAKVGAEAKLTARDDLNAPSLARLSTLSDAEFRTRFSGSPIKRIGRDQFIRNVLYAMGNSGLSSLEPYIKPHVESPHPVIKDAAKWALQHLSRRTI